MLKMQVPDGKPLAGMVHHKIHDEKWTALGIRPHEDAQQRFLWPAEHGGDAEPGGDGGAGARIWEKLDPAFAARCLAAAEKAWAAAQAQPGASTRARRRDRRRPLRRQGRQRRVLLGGGRALRHHQEGRLQDVPREVAALQEGAGRRRRRRIPTSMTWQVTRPSGRSRSPSVPNGLPAADIADCKAADRGGGGQLPRRRRAAGLPRAVQARQEGLPVGLELVRAQQRDRPGAGRRLHRRRRST